MLIVAGLIQCEAMKQIVTDCIPANMLSCPALRRFRSVMSAIGARATHSYRVAGGCKYRQGWLGYLQTVVAAVSPCKHTSAARAIFFISGAALRARLSPPLLDRAGQHVPCRCTHTLSIVGGPRLISAMLLLCQQALLDAMSLRHLGVWVQSCNTLHIQMHLHFTKLGSCNNG